MFNRLNSYCWPAALCLGVALTLLGCEQAGTGTTDTTAKAASSTSEVDDAATENADASAKAPANALAANANTADAGKSRPEPPTLETSRGPRTADVSGQTGKRPIGSPDNSAKLTIRPEPSELDLGQIPTGDYGTGTLKLVNFGSEPVRLLECKTSCGCTTTECPRGKTIEPGDSVEVEIKMNGGSRPQKITKMVRFMFEGQPQLPVTVHSEAVSYVHAEPWTIDRDRSEDGKLVLKSVDEKPFKILRMHPPVIEDFSDEPQVEHVVNLDWTRWEELGSSRRLQFYTDHPKCDKVIVAVQAMYRPQKPTTALNNNNDNANAADRKNLGNAMQIDSANSSATDAASSQRNNPFATPENLIKTGQTDLLLEKIDEGEMQVGATNRTGASLLSMAAQHGQLRLIEGLLDRGANIESRDRIGKTPLMWAGHSKNVEAIRVLLDAGADVRARDNVVGTALSWTAGFGDGESVRELIDAGSDVNVTGAMGFTPLIWASLTGEPDSVAALLEAGADVNVVDQTPSGSTPLMHAAQTGEFENVKVLLEHGAKLEQTNRDGKTALLIAAENSGGNVDTVKTLVEAGADLTATDMRDRNALDLARGRTDPRGPAVVEYLESVMGEADSDTDTEPAPAEDDSSTDE